jgi:hypothetical protein
MRTAHDKVTLLFKKSWAENSTTTTEPKWQSFNASFGAEIFTEIGLLFNLL